MKNKIFLFVCSLFLFVLVLLAHYQFSKLKISQAANLRSQVDKTQKNRSKIIDDQDSSINVSSENFLCKKLSESVTFLRIPIKSYFAENTCVHNKVVNWTMYTFVKSAASNFRQREIIRRTWGSLSYVDGLRLATIFVVGVTSVVKQNLLNEESSRYEDILQINISDTYKNIGHKSLAGMKWAAENLPKEHFYTSADDDFLINVGKTEELIEKYQQMVVKNKWPTFPILCIYKSRINDAPLRDNHYKSYISFEDFKWPNFPDYCLGGTYTTSVEVAQKLWKASRTEKVLKLDDVGITGILRERIGMPRQFIITVEPPLSTHYTGFSDKQSITANTYVKADWQKIYDTFKIKTICFHDM